MATDEPDPVPDVLVVCIRADQPSPWKTTNVLGECSACGAAIQFRPHVPPAATKMCVPCFLERTNFEEDTYLVTRQTLAEIDADRRRN